MKKCDFDTRKTITIKAEGSNNGEKITASLGMFNALSCFLGEAKERYKSLGLYALAEQAEQISKQFFDELDALGMYDDCNI